MQTIEIFENQIETGVEHSSKGNQLKWQQEGWWYKADAFGFESLAEVVISRLLCRSNLENVVEYEPIGILYRGNYYRGCRSKNFRREGEELIPLERLARNCTGFGLAKQLAHIANTGERIRYTQELVRNVTGREDFGSYLAKMLEIDAFFLNEDRHTNNIALLYDTASGEYRLCPFFDMGLSLFSDTREAYPIEEDFAACRKKITAKPFERDFDEQLDAAEAEYGCHLKFDFPQEKMRKQVEEILKELPLKTKEEDLTGYSPAEMKRVKEALAYQAGKYGYFFTNS